MPDQATALRRLADVRLRTEPDRRRLRTIVVAGGRPRVGTTTIATNLALALATHGIRAVMVDPQSPRPRAHVGLIDAGRHREALAGLWPMADEILLVTTPDVVAAMDTYAAVKACADLPPPGAVRLIVNQTFAASSPERIGAGIAHSCQQFLGMQVELLGTVPLDPCVIASAEKIAPLVERFPESPAARAIKHMAAVMACTQRVD